MFSKLSTFAAAALLANLASADFLIYIGRLQNIELGPASVLKFFNNAPDCGDWLNSMNHINNPQNDATISGWACDGCDGAEPFMPNWDITRLELPHGNDWATENPASPLTLYKRDSPGYDLMAADPPDNWGECYRQGREPHELECSTGVEHEISYHMFICYTTLEAANSN